MKVMNSVNAAVGKLLAIKNTLYYNQLVKTFVNFPFLRNKLMNYLEGRLYQDVVENNTMFPREVQLKKYQFVQSIKECALRNFQKGHISPACVRRLAEIITFKGDIVEKFRKENGIFPPQFLVLSPTLKCNLNCVGCYASAKANAPTLDFETVDRIVGEANNLFGQSFMTISGGEPFMYNDNGKTLFDIWEKYDKMFFMVYTNGTLITPEVAKRIAKLGNVLLGISVEGFEKETDERRGKGIFKRILESMENLREAGAIFGISATATSKNFKTLMSDKFYDYFFLKQGATFMWQFQLMPIGQARDMKKLMISPEQRVKLYKKWEVLLEKKKYCIADFWNSGVLSNGCIAYGREGGYFYIDWNGNITPCVFVPYYEDNVKDLYAQGKNLKDAMFSQLMKNGRKWQAEYGYDPQKRNKPGNWLMPCSIRDHWANFQKNILTPNTKPEDAAAAEALKSKEYKKVLAEFDDKLSKLTAPIWKKKYLKE